MGFRRGGAVKGQKLAHRQQVVKVLVVDGSALELRAQAMPVVVVDFHVEAARSSRHDLADPAHADDAQAFSGQLDPELADRTPVRPGVGAQHAGALVGTPCRTEHQQQCNFRGRIAEDLGRVGHGDAA